MDYRRDRAAAPTAEKPPKTGFALQRQAETPQWEWWSRPRPNGSAIRVRPIPEKRMTKRAWIPNRFATRVTRSCIKIPAFRGTPPKGSSFIHRKKPRQRVLTRGQKRHNRKLARVRGRVEHALAGVKRSRLVKDVLRNTKEPLSDLVMVVARGFHNLRVRYRKRR